MNDKAIEKLDRLIFLIETGLAANLMMTGANVMDVRKLVGIKMERITVISKTLKARKRIK